jgi:hypothetical protein
MLTLVCLHDYFVYCTSMHSYICIVAPHLGTLAERCEGCGVGAKPEDGVWWNYPEDGSTQRVGHLTTTDLCRILGKPRSIISLLPSK